jgi:hypothetical protein
LGPDEEQTEGTKLRMPQAQLKELALVIIGRLPKQKPK